MELNQNTCSVKKLISYKIQANRGQALQCNSGQAAIIATLFFVAVTLVLTVSSASVALKEESASRSHIVGKKGYFLSEAGQEDVIYRIFTGKPVSDTVVLSLGNDTATITVSDIGIDRKDIAAEGNSGKNVRKTQVALLVGEGTSFVYGVQVGDGGILMENSSEVIGNVFSNGPIEGRNSNVVRGEVISAGPEGLIDDVHATSSAYAHTIQDSLIEGDAYYQDILNTTVLGQLHSGSEDQPLSALPITDEMIEDWEAEAEAGGVISSPCPYVIKTDVTLGPVKINCDVNISQSPTVTLSGNVWIVGNLEISNTPTIRADVSLGNKSPIVIADKPSNRLTSSKIELENSSEFFGSGEPGSYIVFISQNNSAESGGSERAIEIGNSANGDIVLYAGHGEILLQNTVFLREVTAYKVHLKNSAKVEYNMGLQNVLFSTGPSGGFQIIDWKEIE
ncbi:MAG: hypothetical protein HYT27_03900 [Parcubacteria group bacterium]|nr:hypothetical protein [Parcubacteria group bacterium]